MDEKKITQLACKLDLTKFYNPKYWTFIGHLRKFDELNNKIMQLTGYDIEKLVELFAAGYILTPPKYDSKPMSTLMNLKEGED